MENVSFVTTTQGTLTNITTDPVEKWGVVFISYSWRLTLAVLYLLTATIATVLNGLVVAVMIKGGALKDTTFRILWALAVTDLLTALSGYLNFCEAFITNEQILGRIYDVRYTMNVLTILTSINLAGFVSFDRYLHISRLQSNWKMPRKWSNVGICLCWCIPLLFAILTHSVNNRAILLLPSASSVLSFLIVITCYVLLLKSLRNFTKSNKGGALDAAYLRNEKYASRSVVIIGTFFIGMNFPIILGLLIRSQTGLTSQLAKYNFICIFVSFSNSIVNPLVYCCRTRKIRRSIVNFFPILRRTVGPVM